jgi:hypothetical protein
MGMTLFTPMTMQAVEQKARTRMRRSSAAVRVIEFEFPSLTGSILNAAHFAATSCRGFDLSVPTFACKNNGNIFYGQLDLLSTYQ